MTLKLIFDSDKQASDLYEQLDSGELHESSIDVEVDELAVEEKEDILQFYVENVYYHNIEPSMLQMNMSDRKEWLYGYLEELDVLKWEKNEEDHQLTSKEPYYTIEDRDNGFISTTEPYVTEDDEMFFQPEVFEILVTEDILKIIYSEPAFELNNELYDYTDILLEDKEDQVDFDDIRMINHYIIA